MGMVMPEKSKSGPPKFIPAPYLPFSSGFTKREGAQEEIIKYPYTILVIKILLNMNLVFKWNRLNIHFDNCKDTFII